jgi:hypothetical protein
MQKAYFSTGSIRCRISTKSNKRLLGIIDVKGYGITID